jgi:hypothetical protein
MDKRAFRVLMIFLAVMLCFTLFSRGISNFMVPKVTVSMSQLFFKSGWDVIYSDMRLTKDNGKTLIVASAAKSDSEKLRIGLVSEYSFFNEGDIKYGNALITSVEDTVDGDTQVFFAPVSEISDGTVINNLITRYQTSYSGMVYPISVLIAPNIVYKIRSELGFYGIDWYLECCYVDIEYIGDELILIIAGVEADDLLVTGWDRALRDGERVMSSYE